MKKRGIGLGCMWYGIGNTALPNPSGAYVDLLNDGTAIILTGCADIGQGSDTVLAQIAAEELGISYKNVHINSGDTGVSPDAGATSASRQTYISGNAVRLAARTAKQELLTEAASILNAAPKELTLKDGSVWLNGTKTEYTVQDLIKRCRSQGKLTLGSGWFNPDTTTLDPDTGSGKPFATYAFASQVAEVEVDTETGEVRVLNIVAAHDVGKAINPINVEGQIQGGSVMGLGYALMEEVKVQQGIIQNPMLSGYIIPTTLDVPQIQAMIVEDAEDTGPFGAKGVGEPSLIPTAAAISNAIYNAIGIRFTSLPITAERILAAIKNKEEGNG
jgi:CO/xanthine dehydrogenase Mo-binding subunit